jgi:uncharacterized glyoxalase superfamily protein PhnB
MSQVIPTFRVHERATLQHWVDAFGLQLASVHPADGPAVDHAELRLGDGWIMAGTSREKGVGQPPGTGATYWVLDDAAAVDAVHASAVAAGATSVIAPYGPEYGGRECVLRDREGNVWSFGTYAPGDA